MSVLRRLQAGHYPTIGQQTRKRPAAAGRALQRAELATERILNDTEWPQIVHFRGRCQPCVGRGGPCATAAYRAGCGGSGRCGVSAYRADSAHRTTSIRLCGVSALRRTGQDVRKVFQGRKFVRAAGAGLGATSGLYRGAGRGPGGRAGAPQRPRLYTVYSANALLYRRLGVAACPRLRTTSQTRRYPDPVAALSGAPYRPRCFPACR